MDGFATQLLVAIERRNLPVSVDLPPSVADSFKSRRRVLGLSRKGLSTRLLILILPTLKRTLFSKCLKLHEGTAIVLAG